MTDSGDQRWMEMETRLAFQEDAIDKLSDTVAVQDGMLRELQRSRKAPGEERIITFEFSPAASGS